ncbi:hypothetical protein ACLGIH_03035 [Streptomyces sp. HMX87]|uniref:hypothetical protein n=1 Tax=Streptomyces sp. HMX87 TaxID=3390849 RepID=UPI003A89585D
MTARAERDGRSSTARVREAGRASRGLGIELLEHAEERTRFGRSGVHDVTVRRGEEVFAEFRGRSRTPRRPAAQEPGGR